MTGHLHLSVIVFITICFALAKISPEPTPKNFYSTYTAVITTSSPQNTSTTAQMYSDSERQTLRMDIKKNEILTITIFNYPNNTMATIQGSDPITCHTTAVPSWNPFIINPFEIAKYKGVDVRDGKIVNIWEDVVFLEDIIEYASDVFENKPVQGVFKDKYVMRWENVDTRTPDPQLFVLPSICHKA